jgi:DNA (cytosine-5)-methyltransferase 1
VSTSTLRVFEAFGGIEAMRYACERVGMDYAGSAEIHGAARAVAWLNSKTGRHQLGDVMTLRDDEMQAFEILFGGVPCITHSSLGKRQHLAHPKGRLYLGMVRLAAMRRPLAVVIENTPGIVTGEAGRVLATISSSFVEIGYHPVSQRVLDAARFSCPAVRRRAFLVFLRRDVADPAALVWPEPSLLPTPISSIMTDDEEETEGLWVEADGFVPVDNPGEGRDPYRPIVLGWYGEKHPDTIAYSTAAPGCTLTSNSGGLGRSSGLYRVGERTRRLTVSEMKACMGLPAGLALPVSWGVAAKLIGNSLVPAVGASVLAMLKDVLGASCPRRPRRVRRPASPKAPVALDLFCGAGGLSAGLEQAGITVACSSDAWAPAVMTYARNHPKTEVVPGDVTQESTKARIRACFAHRRCDVVAGGPTCCSFSLSGERDPEDPRGRMVDEFVDVVTMLSPKVALMENVVGALSALRPDGEKVMDHVVGRLRSLGYVVEHRVLNAADYGAGQLRKRLIILCSRVGQILWPRATHCNGGSPSLKPWVTVEDAIGDLAGIPEDEGWSHVFADRTPEMVKRIAATPPGGSAYESYGESWRRLVGDRPARTVMNHHGGGFIHHRLDRTCTARELARLQGFGDDHFFEGSTADQFAQVGNAVPVALAAALGKALKEMMS